MRLAAIITTCVILTGCANPNVIKNSFPDLPPKLMEKPAPLQTLSNNPGKLNDGNPSGFALSTVLRTVTDNYNQCNAYIQQIDSLQLWLTEQKKLNP